MPSGHPNSQHRLTPPASQTDRVRVLHASPSHRDEWGLLAATCLLAALLAAPALAAQDFSHPDSGPAPQTPLIQQANAALAASDFPAALKILTGLNSQTPNNPQVLYDLGLTLEALGPAALEPTSLATNNEQRATNKE